MTGLVVRVNLFPIIDGIFFQTIESLSCTLSLKWQVQFCLTDANSILEFYTKTNYNSIISSFGIGTIVFASVISLFIDMVKHGVGTGCLWY